MEPWQNKDIQAGARFVSAYLDRFSLARNVIMADWISPGYIEYEIPEENTLDDVSVLIDSYAGGKHEKVIFSGAKLSNNENRFFMPTWEFAVEHDNPTKEEGLPSITLDKIKNEMLEQEETFFIDFVKKVTKTSGQYIVCDNVEDALKEIEKIEHKRIWAGKDIEVDEDLPNLQKIRSPRLQGFILAQEEESASTGVITLRQDVTILPKIGKEGFVSYEEQAMMVMNDHLTYIEVKK